MREFLSSGKFDTILGWVWLVLGTMAIITDLASQGTYSLLGFLEILLGMRHFEVAGLKRSVNEKGEK